MVRCNRDGAVIEEIAVPDAQQRQDHRHVLFQRRALEVLVHGMCAGQEFAELVEADRQRYRQANRRPHRITAADPIPEREHIGGIDAERCDTLDIGGDRNEVLAQIGLLRAGRILQKPVARRVRVHHGFCCCEGFRGNYEERGLRIDLLQHGIKIVAIDVGDEVQMQIGPLIGTQRLAYHFGAEIGAANADIDDIRDRLAAISQPCSGT